MFLILLAIVAFMFILAPSVMVAATPALLLWWAISVLPANTGVTILAVIITVAILVPAKYWPEFDMEKAL
jgi:hypothetical protein